MLFQEVNDATNAFFWTGANSSINASNGIAAWTDGTIAIDAPIELWKVNDPSGNGSCVAYFKLLL